MKLAFLIICVIAFSYSAKSQLSTLPIEYTFEDSTVATTTWDSTAIGAQSKDKEVEVLNDGSVNLRVAFENDTTGAYVFTVKSGEKRFLGHMIFRGFIRTKAVSGTCSRRIHWGL